MGRSFLFGSELKALRAHPQWRGEVDRDVLALYMRYSYVPGPYAIYRGIRKLPPGTLLRLPADAAPGALPAPAPYWSAWEEAAEAARDPFRGSEDEALAELERRLRAAVAGQMVADVPLGAFLSGGVDSSAIVALMQAQSTRPVRTFSIGFAEPEFDEAPYARAVAAHLGTDHTELYVSPREALDVIPTLPSVYDEPMADSSQIPTILVSGIARRHVTVALSGDAGDELFGGYTRYAQARAQWRRLGWVPAPLRRAAAAAVPGSGRRARRLSEVLAVADGVDLYRRLVSTWTRPERLVVGATEPPTALTDRAPLPPCADYAARLMYLDAISYLPGDILVKVDRAAMSVSLETRVPCLDHRVVEFAWRLPPALRLRGGTGKWLLRRLLDKYVPRALIERSKQGFGVPINHWLRGPLRDWAEMLLAERRLSEEGLLAPEMVRETWREHVAGEADRRYRLWTVLMFEAWLEAQRRG